MAAVACRLRNAGAVLHRGVVYESRSSGTRSSILATARSQVRGGWRADVVGEHEVNVLGGFALSARSVTKRFSNIQRWGSLSVASGVVTWHHASPDPGWSICSGGRVTRHHAWVYFGTQDRSARVRGPERDRRNRH
jgi:hypothetical protein